MKNGYSIYDTHTHLGEALHSGRKQDVDGMLRSMDSHGVDRSLLIPFPVVEDEAAAHDQIAAAVRAHPGRFAGAACLHPHQKRRRFLDELKRCAEEHGFRVLKLQPQYQPLNVVSERSDFLFEAAVKHGMVVLAHTGTGAPFALPSLFIMPARRFPELPIILGHSGGSVYVGEAIVAASVCPNIHIDVSSLMPHHVGEVLANVSSDRLMAGSDLPQSVEAEIGKILTLDIPDADKKNILWNTARKLIDRESE